jgi:6-phosphogluconolactonase
MAKTIAIEYRVYDGPNALAHAAAEHFLEQAQKSVAAKGKARIAVSGGSTPKRTFELLANPQEKFLKAMPWDKLELFWVDERTVPPNDKDSNYGMTREAMLDTVPLKPEQVFRIEGELPPEEAAARYESTIRNQFRLEGAEVPRFDVLQLGMGDDGHTASIFPHTDAIHELGRIAYANHVPQKDTWRVTLTWPVIIEANDVFFLIGGKDKADPLHRVLQGPYDPETLPSQLIQPKNGRLLFLLDKDAAALLPSTDASGRGRLEITR